MKTNPWQPRFVLGNSVSLVSLLLLLVACSEPKWARDHVNSVDIGLWYLTGNGVQYKLINAGISTSVASELQAPTLYSRFWYDPDQWTGYLLLAFINEASFSALASSDVWCQSAATWTRRLVVLALMAACASFLFSVMRVLDIKTPTWDGEGKQTTLVVSVLCSFAEVLLLIPALIAWHFTTSEYDSVCLTQMAIENFSCITAGTSFTQAAVATPLAAITYWLWRLSHSYDEARHEHQIADGFTMAAKTDNVDNILVAIANKIDIDALGSDGRNALHWACTLHRTSICHVLLKKGASLSMKDRDGWTALHWASRVGSLDIVRLLAKYGADLNIQDRWGTTPLMLTVAGETKAAAALLIELGADVNARNVFGQTALMLCAEEGPHLHQLGMVFLNAAADLARPDAQGMTPLHYAAASGSVNLLRNMLQLCDAELVDRRNSFGETLSQLAELRKDQQVSTLLDDWRSGNPMITAPQDSDDDADSDDEEEEEEDDADQ